MALGLRRTKVRFDRDLHHERQTTAEKTANEHSCRRFHGYVLPPRLNQDFKMEIPVNLLAQCYERRATIITTNLAFGDVMGARHLRDLHELLLAQAVGRLS